MWLVIPSQQWSSLVVNIHYYISSDSHDVITTYPNILSVDLKYFMPTNKLNITVKMDWFDVKITHNTVLIVM